MISELEDLLDEFPGASNQTRCFAHILNLVVKSILHQFDVPKGKANEALNNATKTLLHIADDIEIEEAETQAAAGDDELEDNTEGWVDERTLMDEEEREKLDASVQPVRLVLTKVRSTTWA
jgi:hypothetical protein